MSSGSPEKGLKGIKPRLSVAVHLKNDPGLLGMDILLEHGSISAFPDDIYIVRGRQLIEAIKDFDSEGIEYEIKQPIPRFVTPDQVQSWFPRDPKPSQP